MSFHDWVQRHNIPQAAIDELKQMLGVGVVHAMDEEYSEAGVQSRVRLEAAQAGCHLWRNNVGVMTTETGRPVRYGLANDSEQVNTVMKSADLIGIRPIVITESHVGSVIGQFLSREVKASNWKFKNNEREQAQLAWASLITSLGGDACFVNGPGTLLTKPTIAGKV